MCVCVCVEAPTVMSCIVSCAVISRVIVEKQAVKMRATLSDSVEDTCTDVMDQIAALIFRLPLGSSFSPWGVSLLESHQILRKKKTIFRDNLEDFCDAFLNNLNE